MTVRKLYLPPFEGDLDETSEVMATLLDNISKNHWSELLDAGVTSMEIFTLRRLVRQYRLKKVIYQDYQALQAMLPKLEAIKIL